MELIQLIRTFSQMLFIKGRSLISNWTKGTWTCTNLRSLVGLKSMDKKRKGPLAIWPTMAQDLDKVLMLVSQVTSIFEDRWILCSRRQCTEVVQCRIRFLISYLKRRLNFINHLSVLLKGTRSFRFWAKEAAQSSGRARTLKAEKKWLSNNFQKPSRTRWITKLAKER